ncbi:MAG: GyrI-like domain-containing protein [Saprospiraceae bacterium]|nr:GyrI-like domain-containing protein [Saprospiraceae bacterium]
MKNVQIEPFNLLGISVRTSNANGQAAQEIGALWQKFMSEAVLEKIPNKIDNSIYCLYTDYEGDHTLPYTALLGCKVNNLDEIPEGMMGKSFDGGAYQKFTTKGDLSQGLIVKQWMKIWEAPLDRAYTADFEVFGEKANPPSNAEVDIYIALRN